MSLKSLVLCLLPPGLSLVALGCGNTAPESEAQVNGPDNVAQLVAPQPKPDRLLRDTHSYRGVAAAVDPDWIELAVGWEQLDAEEWNWSRTTLLRRTWYDNSKPKRISVVRTRPGGDHDCEPFLPISILKETHLVSDLCVGDVVSLSTGVTREGEEWALQLTIHRRHGGLIPPMHGDPNLGTPDAYHLALQAEQDWEEKGIPILRKYLNKDGRHLGTKPPYPPEAPMPRPIAKP